MIKEMETSFENNQGAGKFYPKKKGERTLFQKQIEGEGEDFFTTKFENSDFGFGRDSKGVLRLFSK